MIFPPIFHLSVLGVYDAGVPNRERLILRPTEPVNLVQFGVVVCVRTAGGVVPVTDNFFPFLEVEVTPPAWIVLFTCPGNYHMDSHPETGHLVHVFYWQRKQTIFAVPEAVPVVVQLSSVLVTARIGQPMLPGQQGTAAR
jgi:hypothetical protein